MSRLMMMVIRYAGGIHQCICTHIREVKGDGAGNTEETYYYPIQYNWVDNLVYMGREVIGIEYLNVEKEVGATNPVLLCVLLLNLLLSVTTGPSVLTTCGASQAPGPSSECGSPSTVCRSTPAAWVGTESTY